jgi:hypothetical protein
MLAMLRSDEFSERKFPKSAKGAQTTDASVGTTLNSDATSRWSRYSDCMLGRPRNTEAAPYYFTYIDQAVGDDALVIIQKQVAPSLQLFSDISEEKSRYRYGPDKWSIRQVLNHVSDTERAFAFRALWFARGFDMPLPSYDQNVAAAGAEADRVSWADHIEEFRHVRLATISQFQNMPTDAWNRSGIASDNRFTVRALAFIIAGHVEHHLKIVRERYL